VAHVGIKGVVARINLVKVDISIKEDIEPEHIREIGAVWSDNEVIFCSPCVDDIICFKGQSLRNIGVEGGTGNRDARPSEERFIDCCVCVTIDGRTVGMIDRVFEVNRDFGSKWSDLG